LQGKVIKIYQDLKLLFFGRNTFRIRGFAFGFSAVLTLIFEPKLKKKCEISRNICELLFLLLNLIKIILRVKFYLINWEEIVFEEWLI